VLQDGLQIYSYTYYYDMPVDFFWSTTRMIDKYIIKFCEMVDNITDWIANKLAGPRCKCGKKKK